VGAPPLSRPERQGGDFNFVSILMFTALLSISAAAQSPDVLLALGQVDQAIEVLGKQIRTAPTAEAYNQLCRAQFELDAWDAGIPLCEKAVALAPESGLDHLWSGRIYGEKADRVNFLKASGLAKKVRTEFERAVELSPNSWEARTDLAEFYLEAPGIVGGGEDKARAQADALMPLNPGTAHWVRARIAQKKKDNEAAEREYRAAIEASNGGARAWADLAGFYRHINLLDNMERTLITMETRPLDRPAALMDGASMLYRSNRGTPMAIRFARKYLGSDTVEEWPAFKAHVLLGELLEREGDRESAEKEYRAALELAHNFRPAQEALKHTEH
jgi:tetratricopeptide (TPR) repeat protein